MTTVTVSIWHNVARDPAGRHTAPLDGFIPDGRYDVELKQYFEQARMSAAPWNTQAAHARDLKNFLDFLWAKPVGEVVA